MRRIKIGRSSNNDVVINDSKVSGSHCQITLDDSGKYRLLDLDSLNGTYVNGVRRSDEISLNQSDIVRIGNTTLPWQTYFGRTVIGEQRDIVIDNVRNYPPQTKPDTFLVWAILSTLFCFLPFGIVSIVHASRADGHWDSNDYTGAIEEARKAKTWFWWSFGIGLGFWLFWIIYYFVVIRVYGTGRLF